MKKVKREVAQSTKLEKIMEKELPVSNRSKCLSKAIRSIDGFTLWSEVPPVMICRTRISSLNRGLKCGGIPGGMLGVLHGPSQGGKTLALAEILYSSWASGGWGVFVDAECRGVDLKWFAAVCGKIDEIAYYKPKTYEECISKLEEFRAKFRKAKEVGDVPTEAFLAIGIDSINRLTPSKELEQLLKGESKDRQYPLRALMTSTWLDKLIPTLNRDEIFVFIQRESVRMNAMPGQKKYTVKGGVSSVYDGGWICRVTAAQKIKAELKGKESPVLVGEKHEIEVLKNSLGPHLNELAYFYSSVGALDQSPLGLDIPREIREESLYRGLIKYKAGTGYYYMDNLIADNKIELLKWLKAVDKNSNKLNYVLISEELNAEFS